jgi:uncharacterized protein
MFFDVVDSTNSYAKRLAMESCDEGTVVIAREQTKGRGRSGRVWHSGPDMGLYMSVVLRPVIIEPVHIHVLTLAASVAAAESISKAVKAQAGIKWPNDILLDGKKVCGILTEAVSEGSQLKFVVIGAGFNIKHEAKDFPEDLRGEAISIAAYLKEHSFVETEICQIDMAKDFLERLYVLYEDIKKGKLDDIICKWRKYSVTCGRRVRIVGGGKDYEATAGDIDEHGRLKVMCDNGEVHIVNSGEIVFMYNEIVDFHVHCFPDALAKKAVPKLAGKAGVKPWLDGTISDIESSMSNAGISCSVILPIATKPAQTLSINNWAIKTQRKGIVCFGTIHPEFMEWKKELRRIKDEGLKGVKLHPDYQEFFVDDQKLFTIYDEIFNLDLIMVFHAGIDIGLPLPTHCTPERLAGILDAFPGGKIVAAHMGGFKMWDEVEDCLVGKDIYFDTSYSIGWMSDEQAKRIIKNHGYEKILFGTDSPWGDQAKEISKLMGLGIDEKILKNIMGRNAKRLLRYL